MLLLAEILKIRKEVIMSLLDFVNSIEYDGLPFLWINGYDFRWNGCYWEFIR